MIGNQWLGKGSFFWEEWEETSPPNTYSAALARGLPSKGEMRRASIHEQYYVGTGGTSGTGGTGETSGTGGISDC